MMITLPAVTPVTVPVSEPTLAIAVLLLVQVPPPVVVLSVVDEPAQTDEAPVIGAGPADTVTFLVAVQPPAA